MILPVSGGIYTNAVKRTTTYHPAGPPTDNTLTQEDVPDVVEEIYEAQNHALYLGYMLKLDIDDVKAIESQYQEPKERFLHIIIAFLRQTKTKPTWRVIVGALKSRLINLPKLAEKLEAVHLHGGTSTQSMLAAGT